MSGFAYHYMPSLQNSTWSHTERLIIFRNDKKKWIQPLIWKYGKPSLLYILKESGQRYNEEIGLSFATFNCCYSKYVPHSPFCGQSILLGFLTLRSVTLLALFKGDLGGH